MAERLAPVCTAGFVRLQAAIERKMPSWPIWPGLRYFVEGTMTAEYLVNIGLTQVYFDANGKRCAPPGSQAQGPSTPMHYVQIVNDGALLTKTWDIGLVEFTEAQRDKAKLYKRSVD